LGLLQRINHELTERFGDWTCDDFSSRARKISSNANLDRDEFGGLGTSFWEFESLVEKTFLAKAFDR